MSRTLTSLDELERSVQMILITNMLENYVISLCGAIKIAGHGWRGKSLDRKPGHRNSIQWPVPQQCLIGFVPCTEDPFAATGIKPCLHIGQDGAANLLRSHFTMRLRLRPAQGRASRSAGSQSIQSGDLPADARRFARSRSPCRPTATQNRWSLLDCIDIHS